MATLHIVHPESFRSNAQNTKAFARRNRLRVERNDEFACVYLRSRAFACVRLCSFASTVRDRPRACMCMRMQIRFGHGITCVNNIFARIACAYTVGRVLIA